MNTVIARSPGALPCGQLGGAAATAPCAEADRKWVLLATILGSAMAFMDSSVVNVALPTLQTSFRASSSGIEWVVQSYALFGSALLLLGGAVGDHYGRRRAFCWGVALFAAGSAGCAAAFSLSALIAARALQGVGAALLVPQGLSILSASFSGEERGRAIGIWSAWTGVFGALGPVVGGWLLQVWSWRLIFLLNLPLAALVLALAPRIPESRGGDSEQPLDWLGAALATTSFAALIYALSFAPELGWRSTRVLTPLLAGGLLLAAFLASQAGRANAMMPLSLFRIPRFLAPNLLTLLLYGALGGALYVIPFYVIQVRHYRPAGAGAVFLPLVAMMFLFSARVGGLVARVGERRLLTGGAALCGAGFCALAALANHGSYIYGVLPGVLLLGAGLTLAVAPLTTAVMSSVPEGETGIASAVNNALSRLAGLVAVSLLALVLAHGFRVRLEAQLGRSALQQEARAAMMAGSARLHETPIPDGLSEEQRTAAVAAVDGAFVAGFRSVMMWCAVSCWLGAVVVWVLLRGRADTAAPQVS